MPQLAFAAIVSNNWQLLQHSPITGSYSNVQQQQLLTTTNVSNSN